MGAPASRANPTRRHWPRRTGVESNATRPPSAHLANRPASVRIAATAGRPNGPRGYHHPWRRYRDAWGYHHPWRHSAAVVHAGVVAVATAAAIWATVKARPTATSDRNCQIGLRLFERHEWHGLGGGNTEETDADGDSESKELCHSFLLSCSVM